jgi:predicted TIM-barrel fold metal-dependent hydrolase
MIVDCHTHLWSYPGHISDAFVEESNSKARGKVLDIDVSPARHWEAMRGVDKAIVFGMRARHAGIMVPNEHIAAYVAAHPDKIIGFAGVDPTCDDVVSTLDSAVALGLRGVKLGPIYQNVHPTDTRMMAVYEYCEANRLPILIHQGTTFPRTAPLKFAHPLQLEDVALTFPSLRMVIAHLGHPWIEDTLVLIRKHPYLYSDISALHYRPWQFYNALILAKEYGVLDRLLFGTDFPFTTAEATITALRGFNRMTAGTNLSILMDEEVDNLIHSPTLEYLGL